MLAASVSTARELLGTELAALVGESYDRAYGDMVRVQQLTELEEVIAYTLADTSRALLTPHMLLTQGCLTDRTTVILRLLPP